RQRLEQRRGALRVRLEQQPELRREAEQDRGPERPERTPVAEDERRERDEAAPGGHVVVEAPAAEADRQVGASERGEDAGEDHGAVADGIDVDADGVGGARMLAAGADAQADRRREDDEEGEDHEHEREPHHQVQVPDRRAEEVHVADPRQVDARDRRHAGGDVLPVVELEEEVAGDPEREEVDGGAADDLIGAQMDREDRVDECHQAARERRDREPADPGAGLVGTVDAPERTHEHHPLEADVHDAAPLGEEAADAGEDQRRREDEGPGDETSVEDVVQVRLARVGREDPERDSEHAGGDRAPSDPPLAAGERPDAQRNRDDPHEHRPEDRPRHDRGDREERGERAEYDPGDAVRPRPAQILPEPAVEAPVGDHATTCARRRNRRREFQTYKISTSAPTKRTINPWMMYVRLLASCGSIEPDWRPCVVPKRSAPKRKAARPTPTAVLRPRSATAIPRKPTWETGMSETLIR